MAAAQNILIVGGGIAGLTLAVALRRRGLAAEAVELQPRWNILGVGISLTGPTLRALQSIGVIDECVAVSFGFERIIFADAHGKRIGEQKLFRLCGPDYPATVAIGRPALHEVLLRAVEDALLRTRIALHPQNRTGADTLVKSTLDLICKACTLPIIAARRRRRVRR